MSACQRPMPLKPARPMASQRSSNSNVLYSAAECGSAPPAEVQYEAISSTSLIQPPLNTTHRCGGVSGGRPPPELGRCEAGARGERFKLSPHHFRMHARKGFLLREPAVRACDDVLPPHYTGEPHDPVRNYLRMLHRDDVVSNHAGNK